MTRTGRHDVPKITCRNVKTVSVTFSRTCYGERSIILCYITKWSTVYVIWAEVYQLLGRNRSTIWHLITNDILLTPCFVGDEIHGSLNQPNPNDPLDKNRIVYHSPVCTCNLLRGNLFSTSKRVFREAYELWTQRVRHVYWM